MSSPETRKNIMAIGLRDAIDTARQIREGIGETCWDKHIEAIAEAVDAGDHDTLKRYARGELAPGFPYQSIVRLYVTIALK